MRNQDEELFKLLMLIAVVLLLCYRKKWQPSKSAFGTARWATEKILRLAGMLGDRGLVLGRTLGGLLIRLPSFCRVLLVGGSGSGKGVSIIIPQLLTYGRGSLVCFDTKGDLAATSARRRARMGRVFRLAPFNGGADKLNMLDAIPANSLMLVDHARALAEALVVRAVSGDHDPHWNDKAVQVICAILVLVLLRFEGEERSLNSVQEIVSDPALLASAADKLREIGGIPARLGSQVGALFAEEGALTKEGTGVMSTVQRHLAFLDSELVAASVASSTFRLHELLKPGTILFLQIPPEMLDAMRSLLRCWLSTLIRFINSAGDERSAEVLFLIDEASALGGGLPALEEALVRGRSAGVRLLMAYQSDSQVKAAFKDKPTLLYDNCSTQIYLGGANSLETAERLSKMLGEWTQCVESFSENSSTSRQVGYVGSSGNNMQRSDGRNYSWQPQARALKRPEELLTMSRDCLIAFVDGLPPILARRVKWFSDPLFRTTAALYRRPSPLWWLLVAMALGLIAWSALGGR